MKFYLVHINSLLSRKHRFSFVVCIVYCVMASIPICIIHFTHFLLRRRSFSGDIEDLSESSSDSEEEEEAQERHQVEFMSEIIRQQNLYKPIFYLIGCNRKLCETWSTYLNLSIFACTLPSQEREMNFESPFEMLYREIISCGKLS